MSEKEMLKLQKALGPKGNVLRKEYERSVKDKAKRMKLMEDEDERLEKYFNSKIKDEDALESFIVYRIENDNINTDKDVDKYIKDNNLLKSNKKDSTKRDIKKLIKEVEKTSNKKPKKSKTLNKAMNLAFDMASQPKSKKYNDMESIEDIIKEVSKLSKAKPSELKKLVKADKEHIKYHPSEQDKKELKMDKDILLQPYNYKNMPVIDQIANSLKNPEFEAIKKKKIIDSYSYDTISKFNKKYHEIMLKLFKTEEGIEKILKKKADKLEKNKLSEIKKQERLKKYAEKHKAARQVKKAEKTKHLRDLTPEEHKKFTQARSYYMRKSKTSDILPKELNKTDPEALNGVCRQLAITGFNTMSEQLFMKEYEG
jgi:hypothetical protein